jgi:hypothetical protein
VTSSSTSINRPDHRVLLTSLGISYPCNLSLTKTVKLSYFQVSILSFSEIRLIKKKGRKDLKHLKIKFQLSFFIKQEREIEQESGTPMRRIMSGRGFVDYS